MTTKLKSSAQRVQDFLSQNKVGFQVKQLPDSTRTAQEAAQAIGCDVAQIAKSLVFQNKESKDPVLIIASGINQVDLNKIRESCGIELKKANADFVKEKLGFAIGGVPPVAHKQSVTTFLDEDLKNHSTLWAAAGTPNAVFQLNTSELAELTKGQWLNLAK